MECGVRLGGVRVGRRSLVSWWVYHDPDAAKPRPTSVPLRVLLVRLGVVGSIRTLDEVVVRADPSLHPRGHLVQPGYRATYSLPSVPVDGKTIIWLARNAHCTKEVKRELTRGCVPAPASHPRGWDLL